MLLRIAGIAIETTDPSMKPSAEARIAATSTKRRCGSGQKVSSETGLFCGTAFLWDSQGGRMPVEIGRSPHPATTGCRSLFDELDRDACFHQLGEFLRVPVGEAHA